MCEMARIFTIISTCASLATALVPNSVHPLLDSGLPKFHWANISTDVDLRYHECYQDFECARLTLPLDWNNVSSPHNVSIAIIRLPAQVPASHPNHGGTIILNPGGPGGSGVGWLLQVGQRMQRLLDGGSKHYELLSFDPRGVFRSLPNAYCFGNAVESEIWYDEKAAAGSLDSSEYALKYSWAAEKARGELCATTDNGQYGDADGENLRQHVSTASVARDLLEILKKVDQHRLDDVKRSSHGDQIPLDDAAKLPSKLQYFGQSYGTFLGQTFAAMYPEMVGRMVLDANLDAANWQSRYEASIDDHRQIREFFFERCFAGATDCALFRKNDESPHDIQIRFEDLLKSLEESPSYLSESDRARKASSISRSFDRASLRSTNMLMSSQVVMAEPCPSRAPMCYKASSPRHTSRYSSSNLSPNSPTTSSMGQIPNVLSGSARSQLEIPFRTNCSQITIKVARLVLRCIAVMARICQMKH